MLIRRSPPGPAQQPDDGADQADERPDYECTGHRGLDVPVVPILGERSDQHVAKHAASDVASDPEANSAQDTNHGVAGERIVAWAVRV